MHNYLNYNGLAIIPHRGGATEAPENTLASFEYSVNLGAEIIETDVGDGWVAAEIVEQAGEE